MDPNLCIIYISESIILVTGGRTISGSNIHDCQTVDLLGLSTQDCSNLRHYPHACVGAAGAVLNGFPLICGGKLKAATKKVTYYECYKHERHSNNWVFLTNMTSKRAWFASASLNGTSLFVTGGVNGQPSNSTGNKVFLGSPIPWTPMLRKYLFWIYFELLQH